MADNVTVDNGGLTDYSVASDDVGGVQYQRVKLDIGGDGATVPVPGDATNGIDVDVTRVIPGTSSTHLGKAEDAAHSSGDVGVMALTVRQDTPAATSGTTGDYQPLSTDSTGRLYTVGGAVALTNEASHPAKVDVTTAGTGVEVLAANVNRKPGSYIQNISDTDIEFNYGASITTGEAGILSPGGVLKLSEGPWVYQGAVRMYQASGSTKKVWVVSFE